MILGIMASKIQSIVTPVVGTMSWVDGTEFTHISSGTLISQTTPVGIAEGDGLFAFVMTRSAIIIPSGWSLVVSAYSVASTITQYINVLKKDTVASTDSSTSFSFNQTASGRMAVFYAVVRSSTGMVSVREAVGNTEAPTLDVPVITAIGSEIILMAGSAINVASGTKSSPPDSIQFSGTSMTTSDYRMVGAYLPRNAGESSGGAFVIPNSNSTKSTIAIRIGSA